MDSSQRRCFLEVYVEGEEDEEPRLLQLEPHVRFRNVLDRFGVSGKLFWRDAPVDPDATPAALRMPCGVDQANALWFVPGAEDRSSVQRRQGEEPESSAVWLSQRTPLVESTAAMRSPLSSAKVAEDRSLLPLRAPSLPAYFTTPGSPPPHHAPPRAPAVDASPHPATPVSWYSRPRLLSPARPPAVDDVLVRPDETVAPPPHTAARGPAGPSSRAVTLSHTPAPLPLARAPPASPPLQDGRRNRPILIDPETLVDRAGPVEVLQAELLRLQQEVQRLKRTAAPEPRRSGPPPQQERTYSRTAFLPTNAAAGTLAPPLTVPAAAADLGVEELAMDLHDKQMRRLYEQRRFYLTHGQVVAEDGTRGA